MPKADELRALTWQPITTAPRPQYPGTLIVRDAGRLYVEAAIWTSDGWTHTNGKPLGFTPAEWTLIVEEEPEGEKG